MRDAEFKRRANLQVLEVDAQAGYVAAVFEERVERVEREAHFGQVDARDVLAETRRDQVVGVLDRDEFGGAPFGRAQIGERELGPQLVGVR